MALKSGYYGLKRSLLNKVKALPGIKSIGAGLSLNSTTGELEATGATISIEANPEGEAIENLIKLGLGDNIYAVPDAAKTYQTDDATESSIVDADYIPFFDSSAASGSGAPKKSTWTNFIAKIKAKITEYVTWEANSFLGAKNLLKNVAVSETKNTLSFVVNADGSVSFNGTPNANTNFYLNRNIDLSAGNYVLSGYTGGNVDTNRLLLTYVLNGETIYIVNADGEKEFSIPVGASNIDIQIVISSDTTVNKTVYPMIRLATDPDDTYVPYAMTNKELTEKVNAIDVSNDITINAEQTAYNITSLHVQRIGQLVIVTGDITSLTEDAVPQGRSYISIASLLPKPVIDVHAVILPRGSGNQAELYIVGNNSQLQMRGGTVNQIYQFTFTYITAS